MEFSKQILVVAYLTFLAILVGLFILMWRTGDLSPATEIVIGISTVLTAGTSFYFWKARAENLLKISQQDKSNALGQIMEVYKDGLDNRQ